jgi:hypothetical protein
VLLLVSKVIAKRLHKFTKLTQDSKPSLGQIDWCLGKEVKQMPATETVFQADANTTDGADGGVNLWADSVGAAAKQLGVVLTLGIAVHLASNLLFGW